VIVTSASKDEIQENILSEDSIPGLSLKNPDDRSVENISLVSNVTSNGDHNPAAAVPKRVIEPADSDDQTPLPKRTKTTSFSGPSPPSLDVSIRSRFQSAPHPSSTTPVPSNTTPPSDYNPVPPLGSDSRPIPVPDTKPPLDNKPPTDTPATKPALLPTPVALLPTPVVNTPPQAESTTTNKTVTDPSPEPQSTLQIVSLNYSNYFKKDSPFVCRFCNKKIDNSKLFEDHIISYHAMRIVMKDFTVKCHDQYISHADTKKILAVRGIPNPRLTFLKDPVLVKDFRSNIEIRAGKFYCKPCKNIYVNESLIKEHLLGKKHKFISRAQIKSPPL